jgi:hypothetical protein
MKNSNDTIGNRTRGFPAISTVPQRNAPPCELKHVALITGVKSIGGTKMIKTLFLYILGLFNPLKPELNPIC